MLYVYSNNGLAFHAVDGDYVAQSGEVIFHGIASPADLQAAFPGYTAAATTHSKDLTNAPILAQISELESGQARAVREVVLGNPGSESYLQTIDNRVAALRAQLQT